MNKNLSCCSLDKGKTYKVCNYRDVRGGLSSASEDAPCEVASCKGVMVSSGFSDLWRVARVTLELRPSPDASGSVAIAVERQQDRSVELEASNTNRLLRLCLSEGTMILKAGELPCAHKSMWTAPCLPQAIPKRTWTFVLGNRPTDTHSTEMKIDKIPA